MIDHEPSYVEGTDSKHWCCIKHADWAVKFVQKASIKRLKEADNEKDPVIQAELYRKIAKGIFDV